MGLARSIAKVFNLPFLAQVAMQEGAIAVEGSADYAAALPTGTQPHLQPVAGINRTAGTIGGSGAAANEEISCQRLGLAKLLTSPSTVTTRGAQAIADSGANLGNAKVRTPYSSSAIVIGQFEEGHTVGAAAEHVEAEVRPQIVEVVRPVTFGALGVVTAATVYGNGVGIAKATAQVPLYCARFDGETVRNLGLALATAPGGADTVAVTLQKSVDGGANWTDLAVTATITGAAKAASDLTHSAILAAGDLLAAKLVSSAGTAAGLCGTFDVT